MVDHKKTKDQLLDELSKLQQRNAELEASFAETKITKEDLMLPERKYKALVDNSPDFIYVLDEKGNFSCVEGAVEQLLSFTKEELLGKHFSVIIHPKDVGKAKFRFNERRTGDRSTKSFELRLSTKVGNGRQFDIEYLPIELRAFGFYDKNISEPDKKFLGTYGVAKDITERKQAEEQLKNTRDYLNNIIESSLDCIVVTDNEGYITKVNTFFLDLLGYKNEDAIGEHVSRFLIRDPGFYESVTGERIHIDDAFFVHAKKMAADLDKKRKVENWESYLVSKTNMLVPIEQSIVNLHDEQRNKIGSVGICRDTTERQKAEKEKKETRDFLENIFRTSPDGIIVSDSQGGIIQVNKTVEKMLGYSHEELIGKQFVELGVSNDEDQITRLETYRKFFQDERLEHWESIWYRKDGTSFPVEISLSFLENDEGVSYGTIGSVRDISERKRAEDERIRLSSAVKQAAEMIVIMGADGHIEYVNPATEEILGYTRNEILHVNPFQTSRGIYEQTFYREIWETVRNGQLWKGQVTFKKKDGTLSEFEQTITPIRDVSGNIINFVAISRDLSKELKLERQLQQAQKMEAIGTLAGGIAHDFNNILSAIIGYTELAYNSISKEILCKKRLDLVLKSSFRARDLVKQILAFSRKTEQESKPLQISLIIKEALQLIRASIPTTIDIRQSLEADAAMVMADPTQIHQVIMNLCSNASYAMQQNGGMLDVRLTSVVLNAEDTVSYPHLKSGPYVILLVSDTGTGIDQKNLNRIFDPFFTTKEAGKGTGMGLAVAHGIIYSHGGVISVESEVGKGTAFQIFLPQIEEQSSEGLEAQPAIPTGNESILFVDDEESLIDVAQEMLETLGYDVTVKKDSKDALALFQKNPFSFDLVITDQTMPYMTGVDLTREMVRVRPDIPVILCTGFSEDLSFKKVKEMGIRELLMKPFDTKTIAETIRRVLGKNEKGILEQDSIVN